MRWYPWLRPDFEKLVASYQAGRGHHALLIQALPGMGDDALIYALSRYSANNRRVTKVAVTVVDVS